MRKKIKTAKAANRRRFIRHPMCFPLNYKVVHRWQVGDEREGLSAAIDVSRGGLLFSSKHPVKRNSLITIPPGIKPKTRRSNPNDPNTDRGL